MSDHRRALDNGFLGTRDTENKGAHIMHLSTTTSLFLLLLQKSWMSLWDLKVKQRWEKLVSLGPFWDGIIWK